MLRKSLWARLSLYFSLHFRRQTQNKAGAQGLLNLDTEWQRTFLHRWLYMVCSEPAYLHSTSLWSKAIQEATGTDQPQSVHNENTNEYTCPNIQSDQMQALAAQKRQQDSRASVWSPRLPQHSSSRPGTCPALPPRLNKETTESEHSLGKTPVGRPEHAGAK